MAHTDRHTDRHTDGHGDPMTDPAQRAESVKVNDCKKFWIFFSSARLFSYQIQTEVDR